MQKQMHNSSVFRVKSPFRVRGINQPINQKRFQSTPNFLPPPPPLSLLSLPKGKRIRGNVCDLSQRSRRALHYTRRITPGRFISPFLDIFIPLSFRVCRFPVRAGLRWGRSSVIITVHFAPIGGRVVPAEHPRPCITPPPPIRSSRENRYYPPLFPRWNGERYLEDAVSEKPSSRSKPYFLIHVTASRSEASFVPPV